MGIMCVATGGAAYVCITTGGAAASSLGALVLAKARLLVFGCFLLPLQRTTKPAQAAIPAQARSKIHHHGIDDSSSAIAAVVVVLSVTGGSVVEEVVEAGAGAVTALVGAGVARNAELHGIGHCQPIEAGS